MNEEINSVYDNPLIFNNGEIKNSGHFHAENISQAMDILSIAVSKAMVVGGLICKVIVLSCSLCLISLGPLVISISASELVGIIRPSLVAIGRSSMLCVERM